MRTSYRPDADRSNRLSQYHELPQPIGGAILDAGQEVRRAPIYPSGSRKEIPMANIQRYGGMFDEVK
jgi:hypothetical protein